MNVAVRYPISVLRLATRVPQRLLSTTPTSLCVNQQPGPSSSPATATDSPHPRQKGSSPKPPWEDPWAHVAPANPNRTSPVQYVESSEEFKWVERLMPLERIPDPPVHDSYPTPSGWTPPRYPPPDLPYYVRRNRLHIFPLNLETRRDTLDPKTLQFHYVEVVILGNVEGDVFAAEKDLREYLEARLGRKVGTHVNEIQGKIRVRGADRSLLEQFLLAKGF